MMATATIQCHNNKLSLVILLRDIAFWLAYWVHLESTCTFCQSNGNGALMHNKKLESFIAKTKLIINLVVSWEYEEDHLVECRHYNFSKISFILPLILVLITIEFCAMRHASDHEGIVLNSLDMFLKCEHKIRCSSFNTRSMF